MHREQSRHERYIEYTAALRERFAEGFLSQLQALPQWVVWKGELEDGKRKKVPYNPNYRLTRASVKIFKSWGSLPESLTALESVLKKSRHNFPLYSRIYFFRNYMVEN